MNVETVRLVERLENGIFSNVGPKKHDFWPKVNILVGIYCIFVKKCQNLTVKVNFLFQESSKNHDQFLTNCHSLYIFAKNSYESADCKPKI